MAKIALKKTSEILKRMKQEVTGSLVLFLISFLIFFNYDQNLLEIITALAFAVIASVIALGLTEIQITLVKKTEEMRNIEKSLEDFYRPLQNLLNGCDTPINVYESSKEKYDKIGCYRHFAEPDALRYFEKCPQTNENLKDLLKQVDKDILDLLDKYKQLKEI